MSDGNTPSLRESASLRDVAAVAAAVEAAEALLSSVTLESIGAPACDSEGDEAEPTLRVRARSTGWAAQHVRRAAPDPSAAPLLSKVRACRYLAWRRPARTHACTACRLARCVRVQRPRRRCLWCICPLGAYGLLTTLRAGNAAVRRLYQRLRARKRPSRSVHRLRARCVRSALPVKTTLTVRGSTPTDASLDLNNNLMGALHPAGSLYERPVRALAEI